MATMPASHEASNYDEVSMQQSMLFSDGLQVDSEFAKYCLVSDKLFKSPSDLEGQCYNTKHILSFYM